MTPDEYRGALESLGGKYAEFQTAFVGEKYDIEHVVKSFARDSKFEGLICYHLNRIGGLVLKTEDEKMVEATVLSSKAAFESANAAKESAETARSARNISYLAMVFAAVGAAVAAVSL